MNRVPRHLPEKTRIGEQLIWIDKNGNALECGADFKAAQLQGSYPVKVYRPVAVREIVTP